VVPLREVERALKVIQASRYGQDATFIGEVNEAPAGRVQVRTTLGTSRLLEMPSGELLPRIC
jgi:hydrogenase expression/formation protein HypE